MKRAARFALAMLMLLTLSYSSSQTTLAQASQAGPQDQTYVVEYYYKARWGLDYRVTIVFKNLAAAHDSSAEEAIIKKLFPDQETFRKEEQRRFEILIAHWDVPLVSVDLTR